MIVMLQYSDNISRYKCSIYSMLNAHLFDYLMSFFIYKIYLPTNRFYM